MIPICIASNPTQTQNETDKELSIYDLAEIMQKVSTEQGENFRALAAQFQLLSLEMKGDKLSVQNEISSIKSQMVTKDYLDERLLQLRGDIIEIIHTEDKKMLVVVDELEKKRIFSKTTVKRIHAMHPFPKTVTL